MTLTQTPTSGSFNIYRCGDIFQLKLIVEGHTNTPFLRTNLGSAQEQRDALISHSEEELITSLNNWVDLSFEKITDKEYLINLPMTEVGYFEAKIGFKDEDNKIIWSPGKNINIKIEPASTIANNSIYSVFTRQFGPNKDKAFSQDEEAETIKHLDDKGYHVIPPSGTFRDLIKELDHIMDDMGFRILQLLPIHPTPTTYARMGRFGSPYAALDFFSVNPSLAEFDKQATPLDQFIELIDEVHRRKGEIFIDIPVDHTGWASILQKDHPEYFIKDDQGNFMSPGAWGTVWEDLVKLDFSKKEVHHMMADVFLYWCHQGVDGFRCDAGYMIPFDAWEYIIAKVRTQYPNTLFLLEGLGGPQETTQHLLAKGTFSWAYSELFQNYSKEEVTNYINSMLDTTQTKGGMLNFSETHDNNRLAAKSHIWSKMRNLLCALTAPAGGFGISNGVEFFAEEKISVHHASSLNWDNPENMISLFKQISHVFKVHPAFYADAKIEIIHQDTPDLLVCKRTATEGSCLLIVINLNCEKEQVFDVTPYLESQLPLYDLISLQAIDKTFTLLAGEALCLESGDFYLKKLQHYVPLTDDLRLSLQRCNEMILNVNTHINGYTNIDSNFISENTELFLSQPIDYCLKQSLSFAQIVRWDAESDHKRTVMINQGSIILIENKECFNFKISYKGKNLYSGYAISKKDNTYFALVPISLEQEDDIQYLDIQVNIHQSTTERRIGQLALLPKGDSPTFKQNFSFKEVKEKDLYALCANTHGTMAQVSGFWGKYNSKYDSFFAVNMNPDVPVDRTTLLSRFRCWVVSEDFSHELGEKSQYSFASNGSDRATWSFKAPTGQGKYILLDVHLYLVKDKNQIFLTYSRRHDENQDNLLNKDTAVKIIIRPDIEYRSNHEVTKALNGAEKEFPKSITSNETGFSFAPYKQQTLKLTISNGLFHTEPEWKYMHYLPVEADRGLEAHTDLFSPGYFTCEIKEGENIYLNATIDADFNEIDKKAYTPIPLEEDRDEVLKRSIEKFIVRRNEGLTVIAGYPWFLDWGRDTLICLRGIITADMKQEARDIISTFAKYEENGSLPNMIRGNNASNRDTSDAPLWFNVAIKDYIDHFNDSSILEMRCGKRTILQVINSIVDNYIKGTPNGIIMDKESGLIYSPSHFTWMDTNYPAGTPREGYPIEIQALWCATLNNYAHYTNDEKWQQLAIKVEQSILTYFPLKEGNGFSDCLHTDKFKLAKDAKKDNTCRSNQIFLLTLGVVTDNVLIRSILLATQSLIMPGAIRSLKDAPIQPPLAIYRDGQLLNDPSHPYWGNYCGDEDTHRKPAYHNGTGWAWPFFSYCEALFLYTKDKENSLSVLMSAKQEMSKGIINHLPEICDGNTPHLQRGCKAQAWSITEYYRVFKILTTQQTTL